MKTIVEALQDLYVAMGGEAADVADISLNAQVIEQISELVAQSSGDIPEYDAQKAYYALRVNNDGSQAYWSNGAETLIIPNANTSAATADNNAGWVKARWNGGMSVNLNVADLKIIARPFQQEGGQTPNYYWLGVKGTTLYIFSMSTVSDGNRTIQIAKYTLTAVQPE